MNGHRVYVCWIYKLVGGSAREVCDPTKDAHVNCGWGLWKPEAK